MEPRTPPSRARHPGCILPPPLSAVTIQCAHLSCIPTHPPLPPWPPPPPPPPSPPPNISKSPSPILAYCHGCLSPSLLLCRHRHVAANPAGVWAVCLCRWHRRGSGGARRAFLRTCDDTGGEGVTIQVGGIRAERAGRNTGGGQRHSRTSGGAGVGWRGCAAALNRRGTP